MPGLLKGNFELKGWTLGKDDVELFEILLLSHRAIQG